VVCLEDGLKKELLLESRGPDDDVSPATTDALCLEKILERELEENMFQELW
jgi:hypothetical protein